MEKFDLDRCCEALAAADVILEDVLGLEVKAKATLDLSNPKGFDRAVGLLASRLRRAASSHERDAVAASIKVLKVDWGATTAKERRDLVSEAMAKAGRHLGLIPKKIEAEIGETMPDVFRAGRADAKKTTGSPKINVSTTAVDRKAIKAIERDSGLFVTDAMGRRVDAFGEEARAIVARGVEEGLGRAAIARDLEAAAAGKLAPRGGAYWEVVAGAYVGRGRSWSQLLGYQEAGVRRYRIEAVLDRATTQVCRFLHGKSFEVSDGLSILNAGAELDRPEDVKKQNPWVRLGQPPEGKPILFVDGKGGRVKVATIEEAATGADKVGRFSGGLSERGLVSNGIGFPPYHGLCRTTTIPVL